MYKHLLRALPDNSRGHPILTALLYLYCPAAAKLWLAGADPEIPFDPVWKAVTDRSTGATLAEKLDEYGLSAFRPDTRTFIERVDAFRRIHSGTQAPETTRLFGGFSVDRARIFSNHEALNAHMGGKWQNLLVYVHTWVYLVGDWKNTMRFPSMPEITLDRIAVTVSGVRKPSHFPVWSWVLRQNGHVRRALCALTDNSSDVFPQLFAALLASGRNTGEHPWRNPPELWILNTSTGEGTSFRSRLPNTVSIGEIVLSLSSAAESSPGIPVGALSNPSRCLSCGFRRHCWMGIARNDRMTGEAHISEFAFSYLVQSA